MPVIFFFKDLMPPFKMQKRKKTTSEVEDDLREELRVTKAELRRCEQLLERPDDLFAATEDSLGPEERITGLAKKPKLVATLEQLGCLLKGAVLSEEEDSKIYVYPCMLSLFKFERTRNPTVSTDMFMRKFFKDPLEDRTLPLEHIVQMCLMNPREFPRFTQAAVTCMILTMLPTPNYLEAMDTHFQKQFGHLWDARNGWDWEERDHAPMQEQLMFDVLGIREWDKCTEFMRFMVDWKNMNNACTKQVTRLVLDKKYEVACRLPVTEKGHLCTQHRKELEQKTE